jgi:hypothetical protein
MTPEVEITPPVSPAPAVIEVTVPVFVELMVTAPVAPDTVIPVPATTLVTHTLETVTAPVLAVTKIPGPAVNEETPPPPPVVEITPVGLTEIPAPTTKG